MSMAAAGEPSEPRGRCMIPTGLSRMTMMTTMCSASPGAREQPRGSQARLGQAPRWDTSLVEGQGEL